MKAKIEAMKQIADQLDADGHYELARFQREAIVAEEARGVEPVAYMTEDGRVAMRSTVETAMPNAARVSFHIPLFTRPAPPPAGTKHEPH